MSDKERRIEIVNQIIREIAAHDRKFLSNHSDVRIPTDEQRIGYFYIRYDGRLYFMDHCGKKSLPVYMSTDQPWMLKKLRMGGTLQSLLSDFSRYIRTGKYSNHANGHGGLYCSHWGYEPESMERIRAKARELGYLAPTYDEDVALSKQAQNEG